MLVLIVAGMFSKEFGVLGFALKGELLFFQQPSSRNQKHCSCASMRPQYSCIPARQMPPSIPLNPKVLRFGRREQTTRWRSLEHMLPFFRPKRRNLGRHWEGFLYRIEFSAGEVGACFAGESRAGLAPISDGRFFVGGAIAATSKPESYTAVVGMPPTIKN